tara:strand:+ start:20238 stop:20972 length:735 start_codon:yes stop_codon:yes gene_type:complete
MRAVILAAGVGKRLGGIEGEIPKVLISIGGSTLLERHIKILESSGIEDIVIGTGFQSHLIEKELFRLKRKNIKTVHNTDFTQGSIVTLYKLRNEILCGTDIIIMDGDVLYDKRMISKLIRSENKNTFLLDRNIEPGEEPMKIAVYKDHIVDFRKKITGQFDFFGESVGLFKFCPITSKLIVEQTIKIITKGDKNDYMEEAIRNVLIENTDDFSYVDITGLPWIEIDFPNDIENAKKYILPKLVK